MREKHGLIPRLAFTFFLCLITTFPLCDGAGFGAVASGPAVQMPPVVQALGLLAQVVRNIERHVNTKDLSSVHNEDMMLASALTALLQHSQAAPSEKKDTLEVALVTFGRLVANLHAAADAFDQAKSEAQLKVVLNAFNDLKKFYGNELLSKAESLSSQYTCPMHPDVAGKRVDSCPKCGMELDQNIRINLFSPGQTVIAPVTVKATIRTEEPLKAGALAKATLRLTRMDGSPVLLTDLQVVHTERIHLLIVDSSLRDYHHEHPRPTGVDGEYSFTFTPKKSGPYRAWADVRTKLTGFQEYAMADIPAPAVAEPLTDKTVKLDAELEGLRYNLSFARPEIKAGQPVLGRLRITNADGTPFTQLEPVMEAFAHIVGFSEDYRTVLHMHPRGAKLLTPTDRGGPELEFQMYATKPGFIRLYAQIQVQGISGFASFGVNIVP